MIWDDTIAAIATPIGEGGLSIIRVSGRNALSIVDECFFAPGKDGPKLANASTHTLHFGKIVRRGEVVDEVMAGIMRAPRTFTREDTVEITAHGGILASKLVLEAVLERGARLAEPGEFTKRAFLNGRIDLTQAEAVADLIHSRTELALHAAHEQLAGKLGKKINHLRDELMKTLAHIEAHIDFPDEDIDPDTKESLIARLEKAICSMEELLKTAREGQILRRGIRAAIIGPPNSGKSSLLNQLLGHDRAIVSPIPGTTRDTIEETANVRGVPVIFIDTAGLREARDAIEMEGIRRSLLMIERAEVILRVFDITQSITREELPSVSQACGKRQILIWNKLDLNPTKETPPTGLPAVRVSCLTGEGIEKLKDTIKGLVWSGSITAEMTEVMINSRHQESLHRASDATNRALIELRTGGGLELSAMELRLAANAVGEIVGKTTTEDLLDSIFSQFCIGK